MAISGFGWHNSDLSRLPELRAETRTMEGPSVGQHSVQVWALNSGKRPRSDFTKFEPAEIGHFPWNQVNRVQVGIPVEKVLGSLGDSIGGSPEAEMRKTAVLQQFPRFEQLIPKTAVYQS